MEKVATEAAEMQKEKAVTEAVEMEMVQEYTGEAVAMEKVDSEVAVTKKEDSEVAAMEKVQEYTEEAVETEKVDTEVVKTARVDTEAAEMPKEVTEDVAMQRVDTEAAEMEKVQEFTEEAVVTEMVFGWAGLGQLTLEAIQRRDYPLVQGCVLVVSLGYVGVNLLTDAVYGLVDPRVARR
jgi:cell division protein FtsI/penicillin-binding protein 2